MQIGLELSSLGKPKLFDLFFSNLNSGRNKTMSNQTYNGWKNYETWLANVWLTNDDYHHWFEVAADIIADEDGSYIVDSKDDAVDAVARQLEADFDDNFLHCQIESGFFVDLLRSALDEVDFREIAEHFVSDSIEALRS
jgi:hypothetical protein